MVTFRTTGFLGKHYKTYNLRKEIISSTTVGNTYIRILTKDGKAMYNWKPTSQERKEISAYINEQRWDMPSPDPLALEILKEMK